jgi:hypothetical protein
MVLIENENRDIKVKLCEAVNALENLRNFEPTKLTETLQEQKFNHAQSDDFESKFNEVVNENQFLKNQQDELTAKLQSR